MEKWRENFPALLPYISSQIYLCHRCFRINLNSFLFFLDVLNNVYTKMTKLGKMMFHPLPDSYTEWYLIHFNFCGTYKENEIEQSGFILFIKCNEQHFFVLRNISTVICCFFYESLQITFLHVHIYNVVYNFYKNDIEGM